MGQATTEVTVTATGFTAPFIAVGQVALQVTGVATAITLQMQRSTRDPALGAANWAPVGAAISGNPSTGVLVAAYDYRGVAWWRVSVTALTGASAVIAATGESTGNSSVALLPAPTLGVLTMPSAAFVVGDLPTTVYSGIVGKTAGSQLTGAPQSMPADRTSVTIHEHWPGASNSPQRYVFPITVSAGATPAPTISGTPPAGSVNAAYSFVPTMTNAIGATLGGTLAPGLSFNSTTGAVTGTLTTAGTYNATITANGPGGSSAPLAVSIVVAAAKLIQMSANAYIPSNRTASTTSNISRATKRRFRNGRKAMKNIRFLYANTYLSSVGGEMTDVGPITIRSSFLPSGSSTYTPAAFASAASVSLAAGAFVMSDIIPGVTVAAFADFYAITVDTNTAADYRPVGIYLADARGEGYQTGSSESAMLGYLTGATAFTATVDGLNGFAPIGIMGETADGSACECVIMFHDSIGDGTSEVAGQGDASGARGYVARAFADAGYYLWKTGRPGSTIATCLPSNSPVRQSIYSAYGSHCLNQMGENSLGTGVVYTDWEAMLDAWKAVKTLPFVAAKVLVKTSSTDTWATPGNQTIGTSDQPSTGIVTGKNRYNLRNYQDQLVTSGKLVGCIDGLPLIQSPTVPGKWDSVAETAAARLTTEGLHPFDAAAHIRLKPTVTAAITAGWFGPA